MAYVPYFTMPQPNDQYPTVQDFIPTASDNYRWILVDCTQMDLNHHQFVLPLNYVCIHVLGFLIPRQQEEKLCVYLGNLPSQHEVCQPNRKPLSNLFGDTWAYPNVSWLWRIA